MKYKTRGNINPQGKPRVYFTGHPQDCARYFGPLSDLILQTQDCAVFYDPDPEHPEDAENFLSDLDTMQLIVLVVTSRYVYQNTFAHDTVFAHAMERHIPVLPILEERGIEEDFNKKCGDIQFLDATARDDTQQPFEAKLKKYLDAVLVGDWLAQQVRKAFAAHIFLSYRKKDRRFAQQLMRLIHENDFCRDIAIWYDEFLVPGENFNAAIRQALEKSALFALAVTPSLLETPNYVMTEEYPNAKTAGKKILPVRLVKTNKKNKKKLRRCYKALPPLLDAGNAPRLAAVLRDALAGAADPDRNNAPKHLYFIGLAYLGGIDVEVDYPRAVELITRAAEADLPEAIEKLVSMYNTGEGVARDYGTAVEWQRRLVAVRQKEYEANPTEKATLVWLNALWDLGDALYDLRRLPEAEEAYRAMLEACDSLPEDGNIPWRERYFGIIESKLGDICRDEENLSAAKDWYIKTLAVFGPLARETVSEKARRDLAACYYRLGGLCCDEGDLPAANTWYEKLLPFSEQLAKETGTIEAKLDLCDSYNSLGDLCRAEGDLPAARAWYEKGLAITEPLAQQTGTVDARRDLSISYDRLGNLCYDAEDLPAARAWYEKLLALSERLVQETGTVQARQDLSASCERMGNICRDESDLPAARAWYEKKLAIAEQLARETGTVQARQDLSASCGRMGDICKDEGNLPAAKTWYEKEHAIAEQLVCETGAVHARKALSVSYIRLGDLCRKENALIAARAWFEKGLAIAESLAEEVGTADTRQNLFNSCVSLGDICRDEKDLPSAKAWYEKCLAIAKQLAKETGAVKARLSLLLCFNDLGDICRDEGNPTAAKSWYEKCLAIAEQLAKETGTVDARRDLSLSYERLGNICCEEDDLPAARTWYEKAFAIMDQLCQQTDRPDVLDGLADVCCCLARCLPSLAQKTVCLKGAESIWVVLNKRYPDVPQYTKMLALVRKALSETGSP